MYGHDTNAIRSRYDYYYSVSSPSLSQAAKYYENQASLFGEPIATLLPPPIQKTPSPQRIQTPLTPFSNLNASTPSSANTNYVNAVGVHPPLIENFDNHLYESIRRNFLDQQNNNSNVTNALSKHQLWSQNSNSSSNSPPNESNEGSVFDGRRKRASTAFGHYKSDDDVSLNKYRTLSAHGRTRSFKQLSNETASDTDNKEVPIRVFFKNNKPHHVVLQDNTSTSSSSKLNHSVAHCKQPPKKKPLATSKTPFTMVKSKSDLNSLKTYPDSFTIISSPKRSPSAGYNQNKRRKNNEDDDDSIMDFEWVKPPPEKLYEAANSGEKYLGEPTYVPGEKYLGEPTYIADHFGQHISIPSSPIVTDKIIVGSSHRVPPGSFHSHKKIAFAIINDYKSRKTRLLQQLQHRHSDDNMSLSGRFSPYSRYAMQRELSAPALNRLESFESDDGEFYYLVDDDGDEGSGRKTSIGFVHKKQMSASMSNLSKSRPPSELRREDPRYMSTPNFIKINKRAVIQSAPMEKINPRLILHRSLKGVLKVYNNNIRTKRTFSVDNMDIFLPNGKIDPNLLAPMPINAEDKRSMKLKKQQIKAEKNRKLVMKRRKLSPIAGTPNKDSKDKNTPSRKVDTPKSRLEERLKKDQFGRLITPKKASLPNFRETKKSRAAAKKKAEAEAAENEPEEVDFNNTNANFGSVMGTGSGPKKAINFMQQVQARSVLGRTLRARLDAKKESNLSKEPMKQSVESLFQEKPPLKKKSSFTSLKSLSSSIRTVTSFTRRSNSSVEADEEAEAGDEITKLQNVKDVKDSKTKVKTSLLSKTKAFGLTSRLTSASSTRSKKEVTVPPPSRSASKTSILSRSSSKNMMVEAEVKAPQDTPSRKSEVLRAPSASSIMSMTTAAITSNPLTTTLVITNQLATQGAEINEKKRVAGEKMPSLERADSNVASHVDADRASMASQKTISSQQTNTSQKAGSRKTSAKTSGKNSAKSTAEPTRSRKNSLIKAVTGISIIRHMRRTASNDSVDSAKSDATQLTSGPGHGADNNDYSNPGKILEKSQQSLERVQKTVNKATSEIHQTINENLTDLRTLEKKLSKGNLLEHDANNNDVEKGSTKVLSRHSSKLDMAGTSKTTVVSHMSASKTKGGDAMSVNAISVAPDAQSNLHRQTSDDSNQMNSSTSHNDMATQKERIVYNITLQSEEDEEVKVIDSSSMNEMTRKRKVCCGLSSCCGKARSESAQMIAGKSSMQPLTRSQKCGNCCCLPFRKVGNLFKRRKVDNMEAMSKDSSMPSLWERMCCCSSCCRRCKKSGDMEHVKKKNASQQKSSPDDKKPSCWSRMNCFKCCKPCCSRMRDSCCCSSCCRKKNLNSSDSLQSEGAKEKDNSTPGTCTRIFCFCCLCCRKKPEEVMEEKKRLSMTSQKQGNCCSRMCSALLCCRKKKKEESRRTSMLSKKQSLAPTIPPPEEQKPKLDMVLVEHASLMKGAIPVLPLCLAWFCLICNIFLPGTGTIFSGFFCLCMGIPRFSQHDGARGRIGSFIINWIVGVSQCFTIIFCLVGWGWSVWWGTIMLTLARRNRRIKKAEMQRDLDEQMSGKSSLPGLTRGKSRDAEKGIN